MSILIGMAFGLVTYVFLESVFNSTTTTVPVKTTKKRSRKARR